MSKAIGMVEYRTVSSGIRAADLIIKTAEVEVILSQVVCPGKYIVMVTGDLSAVKAAVDAAKIQVSENLVDSFVLGNPHESIFPALYGSVPVEDVKALGVLESYDVAAMIVAADTAAKTSVVTLLELRIARGMSGRSFMLLTGDVAAVEAAIDHARTQIAEEGVLLDSTVIANPDKKLWEHIL